MQLTLAFIVESLGGELLGNPLLEIRGLAPLETAQSTHISFLSNPRYQSQLQTTQAGCVIVSAALRQAAPAGVTLIVTANPYLYYARLTQLWRASQKRGTAVGVHPSAVVDASAQVDATAYVGPLCVVERGARIGAGSVLKSRVTVGEDCVIGARCILHSGVVIGSDGFGFAPQEDGTYVKVPQIGNVIIEDDVEIGACTTVDRATLGSTIIRKGVKLDNHIQVAHNVEIGENTVIASQTGIAGSTKIGKNCMIGGQVGIVGHITIGNNVKIQAQSGIGKSLGDGEVVQGSPAFNYGDFAKSFVHFRNLPKIVADIENLKKQ